MTCDRFEMKGHSSDRCLFVCLGCEEAHEAGKCQLKEFYNLICQWYNSTKHARPVAREGGEDEQLGCFPSLNLVRGMTSSFCIFSYMENESKEDRNV